MDKVKELEQQLAKAKKEELYQKWEAYLSKVKAYFEPLIGQAIISWYRNGSFVAYQILGIQEKYYIDVDGFYGQFSPRRWLELTTTDYINVSVSDAQGKYFMTGIGTSTSDYQFVNIHKKGYKAGLVSIAPINYKELSLSRSGAAELSRIVEVGKTEYEEYKNDPNAERCLDQFRLFAYILPIDLYNEMKAIHIEHVQKTISFWEANQVKFKNLTKVTL